MSLCPSVGRIPEPLQVIVFMESPLTEIREQQRASWNKFSPGWKKWDTLMMNFMRPIGDENYPGPAHRPR